MNEQRKLRNEWTNWWLDNYRLAPDFNGEAATIHDLFDALILAGVPAPDDRKVAAVIYEDELPEVKIPGAGSTDDIAFVAPGTVIARHEANMLAVRQLLTAIRYFEARDAANEAAEREERGQVEALAEALYRTRYGDDSLTLDSVVCRDADGWRAVARKVIADRAPQPEEAGR